MKNSMVGVSGLLPPPTETPPVKTRNGIPLPGSKVPTGSVPELRFVIIPSPVYAERSPVPVAGEFHGPGAAGQGPGAGQKFRNVGPMVNVPPNCSVPFMGLADAVCIDIDKLQLKTPTVAKILEKHFIRTYLRP
jgi:hypothetical protein